ncbi:MULTISPECIES: hypothetical protein [unclassified Nostoc]|uniref:hypothetical protein n=1 Tax=unclassified Nostoc TaxID=2593658 RepID=UPI00260FF3D9|nr:hypothetical protein [Nostoc sp. S13]MDF5737720.1 hypothetical protein [Nostoc sp. S13]
MVAASAKIYFHQRNNKGENYRPNPALYLQTGAVALMLFLALGQTSKLKYQEDEECDRLLYCITCGEVRSHPL